MSRHRTGSPYLRAMRANFARQMADAARGERLRKLRRSQHLSQETAAARIGVSTKSLRSWEQGGGITWRNAKRAAEVYEVDPETLIEREGISESDGQQEVDDDRKLDALLAGQARLLAELAQVQVALRDLQGSTRRPSRRSAGSRS